MSYAAIDPLISKWASTHSLTIYTQYQGEEVRSVDLISPQGRKYQIWIDLPEGRKVAIHAWDYKKSRRDWNGSVDQVTKNLEEAIQTVKSWMA